MGRLGKLIQEIVLHSNYEFVILDIGGAVDGTFQVLDMCRRIYMPVLSDPVSISKIAQFENHGKNLGLSADSYQNCKGTPAFSWRKRGTGELY